MFSFSFFQTQKKNEYNHNEYTAVNPAWVLFTLNERSPTTSFLVLLFLNRTNESASRKGSSYDAACLALLTCKGLINIWGQLGQEKGGRLKFRVFAYSVVTPTQLLGPREALR